MKTIAEGTAGCLQLKRVQELASASNLECMGFSSLAPLVEEQGRLLEWQAAGYAGQMEYMLRPVELLTDPGLVFERWLSSYPQYHSWSLLSLYSSYDRRPTGLRPSSSGRIARYAWGRDYHRRLRKAMEQLAGALQNEVGCEFPVRICTDAIPLLERPLAARSGIGFVGKNTLFIRPGVGSFGFLGEMIVPLRIDGVQPKLSGSCGSCSRCQSGCPTGAFTAPFVLNATKCISYLTIEKSGMLTSAERLAIGEWLLGCDICQEVCPFNHRPLKIGARSVHPDFDREAGVGPFLSLAEVVGIRSEKSFAARFAGTPLMRPGRAQLIRNAACIAHNVNAFEVVPALQVALAEEFDEVARAHLLWALATLRSREEGNAAGRAVAERFRRDESALVRHEAEGLCCQW